MSETNTTRLPRHVAIIMDGNGRWAKAHKLAVAQGHRQGTEALRAIIRESSDIGIEALTIYAFSTENWRRSRAEVSALMSLLLEYFTSEIDELDEKNVCIRILGDKDGLPAPQRDALIAAETRTARNTGLKLNIAINYGGKSCARRGCWLKRPSPAKSRSRISTKTPLPQRCTPMICPMWIC